jgi:hypothetical protein
MRTIYISLLSALSLIIFSCNQSDNPKGKWLNGSNQENIEKIEEHFKGFGVAMFEIGYRYQELYWALIDENWDYAEHQLEEIEETFILALERRPSRKKSAKNFLENALPEMTKFVKEKNTNEINPKFNNFTNACNACHAMEEMPFIYISKPEIRTSPVRKMNN